MESTPLPPAPVLIFDLDGTLADTAPDLLGAANAVLAARNRPMLDLTSLRHMVGFGAKALIAQAMQASGQPVTEEEMPPLLDIFLDHYRAHIADGTRLFPGVAETLTELKAENASLGILTNKPHDLTQLLLKALCLEQPFGAIYGAGRKPYTKPDPRIFHDIVTELMCGKERAGHCVMIGDSMTDVVTARAAGAPCILVSYGFTPVPAAELGADAVLDDFAQLPDTLRKLKLL